MNWYNSFNTITYKGKLSCPNCGRDYPRNPFYNPEVFNCFECKKPITRWQVNNIVHTIFLDKAPEVFREVCKVLTNIENGSVQMDLLFKFITTGQTGNSPQFVSGLNHTQVNLDILLDQRHSVSMIESLFSTLDKSQKDFSFDLTDLDVSNRIEDVISGTFIEKSLSVKIINQQKSIDFIMFIFLDDTTKQTQHIRLTDFNLDGDNSENYKAICKLISSQIDNKSLVGLNYKSINSINILDSFQKGNIEGYYSISIHGSLD